MPDPLARLQSVLDSDAPDWCKVNAAKAYADAVALRRLGRERRRRRGRRAGVDKVLSDYCDGMEAKAKANG